MRPAAAIIAAGALASLPAVAFAANETRIFDPSFRTLKVQVEDDFFAPPVIDLGDSRHITVTFDRMAEDSDDLRYRLIHCNADWSRSQLVESEYLPSFNDSRIDDYAFSQNTFIHFTNYRITIPNEDMAPMVSGNYLLQVYDEDAPDEVLLQARFSLCEPLAAVSGKADAHTDRGVNDIYQQLSLTVDVGQAGVRDMYNDVTLVVRQNGSDDAMAILRHPQRVEGTTLIYEHLQPLIFRAGNEFLRFETVRADYPGMNVDRVEYVGPGYHAYLRPDRRRADRSYSYDQTQHGRFMVREYNATDADLGADYVTVHFTLQMPELHDARVYIDGELTKGAPADRFGMTYDPSAGAYTAAIPLKQGSYNYRYAVRDSKGEDDIYFIDGDKYETRNEYTVEVYTRRPGDRADRLIGVSTITTY